MQRRTLLLMVPGKYLVKEVKQENVLKVNIGQLGITTFCLDNPALILH